MAERIPGAGGWAARFLGWLLTHGLVPPAPLSRTAEDNGSLWGCSSGGAFFLHDGAHSWYLLILHGRFLDRKHDGVCPSPLTMRVSSQTVISTSIGLQVPWLHASVEQAE